MRIIFYAGKGGVGKTSIAAATGIKIAEMGYRTIIISLDMAHSLSDIFDIEKELIHQNKGQPIHAGQDLWVQELDIQEEIESNWGDIHKYVSALLNTTGLDEILAEELSILPGMEEVSLLLYINKYVQDKSFDVIILDCAPTGESLRFISIPTTLEWYIKKLFRLEKAVAKVVKPVAQRVYNVPIPGDEYFDAIADLFDRLKGVDKILVDPEITTVRLVTNPEKIILKETQRAFMYFCLYKMSIDSIIVNRVLPSEVKDQYFSAWKDQQRKYLEMAENFFNPIPVLHVNLFRGEILGYDSLKIMADHIYKDINPLECLFKGEPYKLEKKNGEYRLMINLPFITREDVELNRVSDELIIRIGSYKSHLLLPRRIASTSSVKARYEGDQLQILFKA